MFKSRIILITTIVAMMCLPSVLAYHPYMGAYFNQTPGTTNKVIFDTNFVSVSGANFGSNWLAGVVSISGGGGAGGTSPTGFIYQNGFLLHSNNNVEWAPQYWYLNSQVNGYSDGNVGTYTYQFFFGRIDYDSANSRIYYRRWCYSTAYNVEHDIYTTDDWEHSIPAGDTNFLYGVDTGYSPSIKYAQMGAEATANITNVNWKNQDGHFSVYVSNAWRYYAGLSTRGSNAVCTRVGGTGAKIGGLNLLCDKYNSGTQVVTWYYNGANMLAEGTSLWAGSGTTSPIVQTPFN